MPFSGYESLFNQAPEALVAVERESLRLVAASIRALTVLGCSRQELASHTLGEFLSPEDIERIFAPADSETPREFGNYVVRNMAGHIQECDLMVQTSVPESIVLLSIRDACAPGRLQDELRQGQKMEALGMLSGGIAHDFNNLLTIIAGYSQMLIASPQMTSERDRIAIEQVLKASERAADLTSQLLAFSRRQAVQPKTLDINWIVEQTSAMLGRLIGEHLDLRIHKAADAGRIHADAGQIQQVLINLAINSRDAMPEGGRLEIGTSNVELGEDYVAKHPGSKAGAHVMIEVSDTGTGMDAATRDRIFEPFFTTKANGRGTGLGLSTVFGLVKRWGGSIDLHTEMGQGTTFRVYLPRVEEASSQEPAVPLESRGGNETILLVEDEEGVRRAIQMTLERRGYRVLVAASGPDGLAIARRQKGRIDLLITDLIMPHMNGPEFARLLREDRPSTRLLYISGYAGNVLQAAGTLGKEDIPFLQKPFAPADLTTCVRDILDANVAADGAY